jgi:beta-lactam-binding protein with PASTA domain
MSFVKFIKSKYGRRNVAIVIGANVLLFLLVIFILKIYTRHDEAIVLPDLKGKSDTEARAILEDLGLEMVVTDSLFLPEATAGTVRDQSPKPGSAVKGGRLIFISIFKKTPPMVPINVKEGDHVQIASLRLSNKGIKFRVQYAPNNSMIGVVMKIEHNGRTLKYGELLEHGKTVVLTVGEGVKTTVPVPNLFGLSFKEAIGLLTSLNLSGQGFFEPAAYTSSDSAAYRVCRQDPKFSSQAIPLAAGRFVDFWLSKEPCTIDTIINPFDTEQDLFVP